MSIFTGAGVALITPMNPDGSINYPEMEHIINDQIAGGTDAVIVCGTTGETATMTYDEHIETIIRCGRTCRCRRFAGCITILQ